MDVRTEIQYPQASVAEVYALALDPEFRAAVCRATLAVDHEIDVQVDADGSTVVTVTRTMPATVPDIVKRFVGESIEIVQVETWAPDDDSGRRTADLSLYVVDQPAAMRGTLLLDPAGGGARQLLRGEIRVKLPFIGSRFEAELARGIVAAARREEQIGLEWLGG